MKKILYVTNISRTVNTFFIPHMNRLVEEGHQVDCACKISGEHELERSKMNKSIKFYDIPFTRNPLSYKNILAFMQLYKIQKRENYDVIHVHTPIASFYTRLLKIFYKKVKMIYTAHGFHFYKGSSKASWLIYYNLERIVSKYTDLLITINEEDYKISKNFKCKEILKMNGVGVDFSEFKEMSEQKRIAIREELNIKKDDFVLIMVGEHNKNKNQMQLIKAMEQLRDRKNIKAIMIGDGELLEVNKEYIKKNKIENVKILGFRKDVNELVNSSDVLVSMSYREGLPKNVLEGMACKKAIIATNIRGNRDLILENENGYLVEVGDVEKTVDSILKVFKAKKYIRYGEESYKLVEKYSIEKVLKELVKIY